MKTTAAPVSQVRTPLGISVPYEVASNSHGNVLILHRNNTGTCSRHLK